MSILTSDISTWYVVFWRKNINKARRFSRLWWEDFWAIGGYRHVSAFGYSPGTDCWVHFNPQHTGIEFVIKPEGSDAQAMISTLLQCGSVIEVEAVQSRKFLRRGPFTCVSAVKHLIGSPCGALTPWGLRKNLLQTGKEWANGLQDDPRTEEPADCSG